MPCGKPSSDSVAVPCKDHRILDARGLHNSSKVVSPLVEDRPIPGDNRIGQAEAAAVEHHDPTEVAEPLEEPHKPRIVFEYLHWDQAAGSHNDVVVGVAFGVGIEHAVGNVCAVLRACVHDFTHGLSLAPRQL